MVGFLAFFLTNSIFQPVSMALLHQSLSIMLHVFITEECVTLCGMWCCVIRYLSAKLRDITFWKTVTFKAEMGRTCSKNGKNEACTCVSKVGYNL